MCVRYVCSGLSVDVAEKNCLDGRLTSRIRLALYVYERRFPQDFVPVFSNIHHQLSQGCGSHTLGAAGGRFLERYSDGCL